MKKLIILCIIAVWVSLIYILFKFNMLTGDLDSLNQFFESCGNYKMFIFIILSSLRIAALIPSAVFMILGGMIFDPLDGFTLTLISIILSETVVFAASKILVRSCMEKFLVKRYPNLHDLLLKNHSKILALGILCPVAPSDAVCFLASSTGISYKKFILTVIGSNMPMIVLYCLLGNSMLSSINRTILIAAMIVLISLYSIHLWHREQSEKRFRLERKLSQKSHA